MDWHPRTRELAVSLTRHFSQTSTPGETSFPTFLRDLLVSWSCFIEHPENLRLLPTLGEPLERSTLFALLKGRGRRAVILTGHYDVVGVENYGSLSEFACQPDALLPRLVAKLEQESLGPGGLPPMDSMALRDLKSGQFLPGRGLLDMKSGLAAGLAVMERFGQLPLDERPGSLLFITVPDEEIDSNGARSAAQQLPGLCREWGIEPLAVINLDASNDPGDGTSGQTAYLGSIGKLLPSVYFAGRETHAGSPFAGANPALFAAELVRRIECSPDLADQVDGEAAAPPTCLKLTDTKTHYDVTTPQGVWCYFNWLTLHRTACEVLEIVSRLALESMQAALGSLRDSADRYAHLASGTLPGADWQPRVFSFTQVRALAVELGGQAALADLQALERELAARPEVDTPALCLRLTERAWSLSGLHGPAALVGFASLHYPPAVSGVCGGREQRLHEVVTRQVKAVSREAGTPLAVRPFFPGISDISFFSGQIGAQDLAVVRGNTPAWQTRAGFEPSVVAGLDLPAANIGPWGRDYHQRTERVHMPYSFAVLPELLWRIAGDLLSE